MNKTIDILGVEFIEREDGLYECPDGYNITMDQWKDNIFYGMTMLFIETEKGLQSTILCPNEDWEHIEAFNKVRASYGNKARSHTQLSCDESMYGIEIVK